MPAEEWHLGEEGRRRCGPLAERLAAFEPRALVSSTEPQARETADLVAPVLALDVRLSDGLRETARRTVGWLQPEELERGIRGLFERPGKVVFGEESASTALARFEAALEGMPEPSVVVSHGTVISLYAAARTGEDPFAIWRSLALPEVLEV